MRDPSDMPGDARRPTVRGEAPRAGSDAPMSVPPVLVRLKRRADFLHAAKGKRWHGKALSLHAAPARSRETRDGDPAVARVGYTLTKKVGNSVVRNRARRRLREAVRLSGDLPARAGYDYVIVGRIDAVRVAFAALKREVGRALGDVHGARPGRAKPHAPGPHDQKPNTAKPNTPKPRTIRP